eukprot:3742702-Pyramimonas_sp.AAC.2
MVNGFKGVSKDCWWLLGVSRNQQESLGQNPPTHPQPSSSAYRLLGSLSAAQLRGLDPEHFDLLALPVGDFIAVSSTRLHTLSAHPHQR